MGADPIACAALAGGADVKAFFVRKEAKTHGLARRIEGPLLEAADRCMLVEDVVTTGGSTLRALEAIRDEGHEVCGVLAICDRLAGGAEAIAGRRGRALRGADHDRRGLSGAPGPRWLAAVAGRRRDGVVVESEGNSCRLRRPRPSRAQPPTRTAQPFPSRSLTRPRVAATAATPNDATSVQLRQRLTGRRDLMVGLDQPPVRGRREHHDRVAVGDRLPVLEADLGDVDAQRVGQRGLVLQPGQRLAAGPQPRRAARAARSPS